jgi:hypothetical protein
MIRSAFSSCRTFPTPDSAGTNPEWTAPRYQCCRLHPPCSRRSSRSSTRRSPQRMPAAAALTGQDAILGPSNQERGLLGGPVDVLVFRAAGRSTQRRSTASPHSHPESRGSGAVIGDGGDDQLNSVEAGPDAGVNAGALPGWKASSPRGFVAISSPWTRHGQPDIAFGQAHQGSSLQPPGHHTTAHSFRRSRSSSRFSWR